MSDINTSDLLFLRKLVSNSFKVSRAFRTDKALEIDDLVQEGILYLLANGKEEDLTALLADKEDNLLCLTFKRGIQYYLRDRAGMIKTPRGSDIPDEPFVYPPLDTWEKEDPNPMEEYYDDAVLHEMLLIKCNSLLVHPDNELILLHFGLQGVLPSGLAYAALSEIFGMHRSNVGKRINSGLYTLSKDEDLRQAYMDVKRLNEWMF